MSKPHNSVPLQEWIERSNNVLRETEGKYSLSAKIVNELFFLHNDRIRPEEFGKHCGKCVSRVITRLREHLTSLSQQDGTE